jgi:hypothetical protein
MCPDWTGERASGHPSDFDGAVEAYREALVPYLRGDPTLVTEFFSRSDDVTLANPLGPPRRGAVEVDNAIAGGPPNSAMAQYVVSRKCLDTALPTLATSSRSKEPRRGCRVVRT